MTDWFILRTPGRKIPQLIEELGQDNTLYLTEKTWIKPPKKHSPVLLEKPLIPGWVFVRAHLYDYPYKTITYGPLKYGKLGPIFVEDHTLEPLRQASLPPNRPPSQRHTTPAHSHPRLPIGSKVTIVGIFDGLIGTITGYSSQGYVRLDTATFPLTLHPSAIIPLTTTE